jgi:alanine racemase
MARRAISPMPNMPDCPPPSLRLRVDGQALAENWRRLDCASGTATAGAAVKADAYGLGIEQVAPVLRAAGARQFYVAHWSEVAPLLAHVPAGEIAVLHGAATPAEAAYALDVGVRPVINSLRQAALWQAAGGGMCDLMIDTGMNRLGVPCDDLGAEVLAGLQVDTVHSHLASADEDDAQNAAQRARFSDAAAVVPARRRSLANSAGIALGSTYHFDLTRPGLALYGGVPRAELAGLIQQVACPQTTILQLRAIEAGDRVGYNGTYVAQHAMRIATVSLGYADGYLRAWSDRGMLKHEGVQLPVIGRISMDLTIVAVPPDADVQEGDWLDVIYSLPDAAERTGLSQYELLTMLGRRFARSN